MEVIPVMPVIQCAFVFLFHPKKGFYAVMNQGGCLGAPGGKRESNDQDLFATARREFLEETNSVLPKFQAHSFFEWADQRYLTRVYYRTLSQKEADMLRVGPVKDTGGHNSIVKALWVDLSDSKVYGKLLDHIKRGLKIHKTRKFCRS
jgi:8-oxo-dGTP pyrophosphatase MutT (NUDIX family)